MWDTRRESRGVDPVSKDGKSDGGHEVFGPVQARRIDWNQEMFKEEEVREQAEAVPASGKASSSGQPMEVDDDGKRTVPEQVVAVDATKVTEENEDDMGTRRS